MLHRILIQHAATPDADTGRSCAALGPTSSPTPIGGAMSTLRLWSPLTETGLRAVAAALLLRPAIEHVDFAHSALDPVGCRYLAAALPRNAHVRAISMRFTHLSRDLMAELVGGASRTSPAGPQLHNVGQGILAVPELLFNAQGWEPDTLEPLLAGLA